MGYGYFPYFQGGINPVIYDGSGQQLAKLSHATAVTTIEGAEATNDDVILKANTTDTYSYLKLFGDGWIYLVGKGGVAFYEQTTKDLEVTYASNKTYIKGGGVTGDDLHIQANAIDDQARIIMNGNSNMYLDSPSGTELRLSEAGTTYASFEASGNDLVIDSKLSNGNIFLNCAGSGLVKFGTYTNDAGVVLDGYITIIDAGGTTRLIAVVTT
jgi:hypothetical protein